MIRSASVVQGPEAFYTKLLCYMVLGLTSFPQCEPILASLLNELSCQSGGHVQPDLQRATVKVQSLAPARQTGHAPSLAPHSCNCHRPCVRAAPLFYIVVKKPRVSFCNYNAQSRKMCCSALIEDTAQRCRPTYSVSAVTGNAAQTLSMVAIAGIISFMYCLDSRM